MQNTRKCACLMLFRMRHVKIVSVRYAKDIQGIYANKLIYNCHYFALADLQQPSASTGEREGRGASEDPPAPYKGEGTPTRGHQYSRGLRMVIASRELPKFSPPLIGQHPPARSHQYPFGSPNSRPSIPAMSSIPPASLTRGHQYLWSHLYPWDLRMVSSSEKEKLFNITWFMYSSLLLLSPVVGNNRGEIIPETLIHHGTDVHCDRACLFGRICSRVSFKL